MRVSVSPRWEEKPQGHLGFRLRTLIMRLLQHPTGQTQSCGQPFKKSRKIPHFHWNGKLLAMKLSFSLFSLVAIFYISFMFKTYSPFLSSVQFSRSVMSDSELQHPRLPCPSPTPGVHANSRPSSRWCHPAISSSVVPFSSCPQSLPASESFPMNQLFSWGGQSIGVSALASVLPKNTQDWSPLEWTGCISLQSKRLSRVLSNTTVQKHQFFSP